MTSDFLIISDNMSDLPRDYCREHDLILMSLSYMIDGKSYSDEDPLPDKEFYALMRGGSMPTTSQVNQQQARECMLSCLERCSNLLCIAFSSGLSGTYQSMHQAAAEIMKERPDCRIEVIDSLAASLGEGLLVHKAVMLREQGCSMDEVATYVLKNRLHIVHNFTVDNLFHLHRGGRVSRSAAILGTLVNIKPILHVDNEGHLIPTGKVRGRRRSITEMVDAMEKQIGSYRDKNDIVFISHGDCEEDAQYLSDLIKERLGIDRFLINYVGPTIGAHSGPGTLALFYLGEYR